MKNNEQYEQLKSRLEKIADLTHAESALSWDQQTYMPKAGAASRGRQISILKTLAHEWFVSPEMGDLIQLLYHDQSLNEDQRANVELIRRDYLKRKKIPQDFVESMSKLCAESFTVWAEAKQKNNFKLFEPYLEKIVQMKREEVNIIGFDDQPYDALLDDYEPGLTVKKVDEVFDRVKKDLFPLIKKITSQNKPESTILTQHYPKNEQYSFVQMLLQQMSYSEETGRSDFSPHPFCTTLGAGDVRITLWVDEQFLPAMIFAAIHEAGHAQYEMGLPVEKHFGMPLASAISMAFHESQSRFWENNIGRSKSFWVANYPKLQKQFPKQLSSVSLDDFYSAINEVTPSLIRVEADELTYHAHIYIRYQVERALIEGKLQVKDLPDFWNEQYESILGIKPPSDQLGCLQDVHWVWGAFGYFPTYSLGSFYAAQLMEQVRKDIQDVDQLIKTGNLTPILNWLRKNVHDHGRKYNSEELLKRVTGKGLDIGVFLSYIQKKYGELYKL